VDQHRFPEWQRVLNNVPSRRDILRGLGGAGLSLAALSLSDVVEARKKRKKRKTKPASTVSPPATPCAPKCGRSQCGDDGCGGSCGSCPAGQFCRSGTCCTPEPPAVTCAGRCGPVTTIKTCGQPVACSCPAGQVCLSNGSCAVACNDDGDCSGCYVCGGPTTEGARHCVSDVCGTPCSSTAECPPGTHCQPSAVGCPNGSNQNQCTPLCNRSAA